jgi:hypothetical protein
MTRLHVADMQPDQHKVVIVQVPVLAQLDPRTDEVRHPCPPQARAHLGHEGTRETQQLTEGA